VLVPSASAAEEVFILNKMGRIPSFFS